LGGKEQTLMMPSGVTSKSWTLTCPTGGGEVNGIVDFKLKNLWSITTSIESEPSDPDAGKIYPMPLEKKTYMTTETEKFIVQPKPGYVIDWVKLDSKVITPTTDIWGKVTHEVPYDANKKDRQLRARFIVSCPYLPEDSIRMIGNAQETSINEPDFVEWTNNNKGLVIKAIEDKQCEYENNVSIPSPQELESMFRNVISRIERNTTQKKPALFGVYLLTLKPGHVGSNLYKDYNISGHALLSLNIKRLSPNQYGFPRYKIHYLDPNIPGPGDMICEMITFRDPSTPKPQPKLKCTGSPYTEPVGEFDKVILKFTAEVESKNNKILSTKSIRSDPNSWLEKNYTRIHNPLGPSGKGACFGWVEFNAYASIVAKECPCGGGNKTTSTLPISNSRSWLSGQMATTIGALQSVWSIFIDNIFK
jgi:hypothetical protein